jgi:hypothetical protein
MNLRIEGLERCELIEQTIPPLARHFGLKKEEVYSILYDNQDVLVRILQNKAAPDIRKSVNEWWRQYRPYFLKFGLGKFQKNSVKVSKLPEPTYDQFVILAWLTAMMEYKKRLRELRERVLREKAELAKLLPWGRLKTKMAKLLSWWRRFSLDVHRWIRKSILGEKL